MKLRLKIGRAGIGFVQNPGDEIEVGEAEGARMIAAGQAEAVEAEAVEEVEAPAAPTPAKKKPTRRPRAKRETTAKAADPAVETADAPAEEAADDEDGA
ncbi:hypothetical protein ACQ5SO_17220 [Rhodovulum sp. DZ06]|uniref:hypothetical protein n=1 Tax=Rhodovulum sp. DZ06 TaxID=3425126 RepID=UPI003D354B63